VNSTLRSTPLLWGVGVLVSVFGTTASAQHWVDLGDEGRTLYASARLTVPARGEAALMNLATDSLQRRVAFGVDRSGDLRLWLYQNTVTGKTVPTGETSILVLRIRSHAKVPDDARLAVFSVADGIPQAEPKTWTLVNRKGFSDANLAKLVATPAAALAHFSAVRVGPTWETIRSGPVLDDSILKGAPAPDLSTPDPVTNPKSALMLNLRTTGTDPDSIHYGSLPALPAEHTIISDVRDRGGKWVHQHAYLTYHGGRYWAMWSDGPGVKRPNMTPKRHRNIIPGHDRPGTRVSYATSEDGLTWSEPTGLSGPPRIEGFGWIARGYWVRDDELLALASHFNAPGYPGKGLSLEAFRWDQAAGKWVAHGTVLDDTLNNFPPKRLPNGKWMMSRRDHKRDLSVAVGGVDAFGDWETRPVSAYGSEQGKRPEEPYWYVLPDGRNLVGLFRNNAGKSLIRAFSTDCGQTWTPLVNTNFPDATSKFYALRTSRGYYALVSNSRPARRDPLTLAISHDGLVYTHLFYLIGGRHIDYPHMIEHDGHLLIAFSGAKQTMEVLRVSLTDLDRLITEGQPE
jgi:hypothetical protein